MLCLLPLLYSFYFSPSSPFFSSISDRLLPPLLFFFPLSYGLIIFFFHYFSVSRTHQKSPFHTLSLSHGLWFIALFFAFVFTVYDFCFQSHRSRVGCWNLYYFPFFYNYFEAVPSPPFISVVAFWQVEGYVFFFLFIFYLYIYFFVCLFMAALLRLLACSKMTIFRCLCLALVPFCIVAASPVLVFLHTHLEWAFFF